MIKQIVAAFLILVAAPAMALAQGVQSAPIAAPVGPAAQSQFQGAPARKTAAH